MIHFLVFYLFNISVVCYYAFKRRDRFRWIYIFIAIIGPSLDLSADFFHSEILFRVGIIITAIVFLGAPFFQFFYPRINR